MSAVKRSGWSIPAPNQIVSFGIPLADALPEALGKLSMSKVAVVTTNSLAGSGGLAETLAKLLGPRLHSLTAGVKPHTPRTSALRVAAAINGADGVVTIGGGSVHDTVKAARLFLANDIQRPEDVDRFTPLYKVANPGYKLDLMEAEDANPPSLPFIAIPTTLSAGEFTPGVGVTDERGPIKQVFVYPRLAPDMVILDPEMTRHTPARLFFASGMRAVDHAVESWCSINATALSEACSLHAARLLIIGLREAFSDPDDMQARLDCQQGAWLSIRGGSSGVKSGASHGFGHALGGTAGMLHGDTSCVMLPHVLRYNASVNAERQAAISAAVGQPGTPLADIIASLVAHLGLPGRLRDAGVAETLLDKVAAATTHDSCMKNNPLPIESQEEARRVLQEAW